MKNGLKKVIGIIAMIFLVISMVGCGTPSGVKTGGETSNPPEKSTENSTTTVEVRKVAINKTYKINGLAVIIGEVQISPDKILIGTTVKNPSTNKLSFYPDQGSLLVGSMQMDANMFMTEGKVSGDIQSGAEKSGVLAFTVPEGKTLSPKQVTKIAIHWGDVYNEKNFTSKPFDTSLEIK